MSIYIRNREHRRSACDLIDLHGQDAHAPWWGGQSRGGEDRRGELVRRLFQQTHLAHDAGGVGVGVRDPFRVGLVLGSGPRHNGVNWNFDRH